MDSNQRNIIFFDGVCNLCNSSVDFIIRRDSKRQFQYASLQGEAAKKLLTGSKQRTDFNSILFYEDGKVTTRSKAVLSILVKMSFPWNLFVIFKIIPPSMSDVIYNFVAKNRYKMFGKKDVCRIPSHEEKEYFLD